VNSLTALTRIEGEIVVLVRSAVSGTLGTAGTVADELVVVVRDVVAGAVQATEQVGTALIASAKSIAKGVVLGVHELGGDPRDVPPEHSTYYQGAQFSGRPNPGLQTKGRVLRAHRRGAIWEWFSATR
jgi:hypothetical protein